MDIDLLSKMVKELILDHDRVVLPGLGSFVAEIVPSSFSDKGYTINPPYRRLYFRSRPDEGGKLVEFYASGNNLETEVAERIIKDFLVELKSILHTKKTVVFPGLGRLRATKENNIFFVANEDLDIYPAGFGLEPISLKTHQETKEEVSAAVVGLKSMLSDTMPEPIAEPVVEQKEETAPEPETEVLPMPEPVAELKEGETSPEEVAPMENAPAEETKETPIVAETKPEPEVTPEPEQEIVPEPEAKAEVMPEPDAVLKKSTDSRKALKWVFGAIVGAAVIFLVALAVVGRICPELVDPFLYTEEELRILNHVL